MNLREVKRQVGSLNTKQLVSLDAWIHGLLEGAGAANRIRAASGAQAYPHKTYRQELVRCGKQDCKCAAGELHGPYWYAYWREGGRTKSQYVGKTLPIEQKARARSVR
jgi:hypothetical protein